MRPSSLGGGRILRRTLSVCLSVRLSVRPSRYRTLPSVTSRHLANYNDTHVLFGRQAEGRISYGHLGRTNSCYYYYYYTCASLSYVNGPMFQSATKNGHKRAECCRHDKILVQRPFSTTSRVSQYQNVTVFYYRATLCVSAVFADARCPSVRLSVTLVDCIQIADDIVKLFLDPVAPSFQFFDHERRYPIPRGTRSAGAQNTRRVGKVCNFRLKFPFISETVRNRPMLVVQR